MQRTDETTAAAATTMTTTQPTLDLVDFLTFASFLIVAFFVWPEIAINAQLTCLCALLVAYFYNDSSSSIASSSSSRYSRAAAGDAWESKLVYARYDGDKLAARHELFDLGPIIDRDDNNNDDGVASSSFTIDETSPLRSKIARVAVFVKNLGWQNTLEFTTNLFTHHFVGIETESGHHFTVEKSVDCILLQSCSPPEFRDGNPVVWRRINGEERCHLRSVRMASDFDRNPKDDMRPLDVIKWIHEEEKLNEPYHLANSNCQHFAQLLWGKLSNVGYPNPANFASTFPFGGRYTVSSSSRHVMVPPRIFGVGLAGGVCGDKLVLWGGCQLQKPTPSSGSVFGWIGVMTRQILKQYGQSSTDLVHVYSPGPGHHTSRAWISKPARGAVHPGPIYAASAVVGKTIYLSGGMSPQMEKLNALSTLSSSGEFKRLRPKGDVPSPRCRHIAWSYDGRVFFYGGIVSQRDESRSSDFVACTFYPGDYYTNEIYQYDPRTNIFARVITNGDGPTPHIASAIARLDHRVFFHGGSCNAKATNDFFMLDMKTLHWTRIQNAGSPSGLSHPSLSRISERQLFLLGGRVGDLPGRISNRIAVFDVDESQWKEEAPLSPEFCGSEGGLMTHGAFVMQNENGVSVICVGGSILAEAWKHPSHVAVFDYSC